MVTRCPCDVYCRRKACSKSLYKTVAEPYKAMTESSSGGNTLQISRLDKTDIAFDSINMALLVV